MLRKLELSRSEFCLSIASSFTQDLFKAEQSLQLCKVCKFNHDTAGFLKKKKRQRKKEKRLKAKTEQSLGCTETEVAVTFLIQSF